MSPRLPKLIAFDLDYTLWDLWIDTHVTRPLHRQGNNTNEVLDKYNQPISLYKGVPEILSHLRTAGVIIAACSRTSAPALAYEALRLLLVPSQSNDEPPKPVIEFFSQSEIYPGSKITHFKQIHEKTGLPYSEMVSLFSSITFGLALIIARVTFYLASSGVNNKSFEKGLVEWRKRHPAIE
ncbi:magnesium-dependent phosphatase-1 [Amanita muscaria]